MPVVPGTRLGPYEVTAQIGVGGMGEVYRATDTKLGREVAIKVLPESLAHDADRLARFDREARTLATLNHPNIAAIYGLEDADPSAGSGQAVVKALVMELVEGPTLADRIAMGAIPWDEALPIAQQMADALEAAHEQGIVHRDLKPANVKVRPDGTVKVLDFGLAKAIEAVGSVQRAAGSGPESLSPTITTPAMTQAGLILGTAAYMSPEQARGRPVDKRADIWAFGVVLFEMLTGQRPFGGEEVSDVLASVLARDPDLSLIPDTVPGPVRQTLRACLQKDPKQRARDIGDVKLAMAGAFQAAVAAVARSDAAPERVNRWRTAAWIAAAAVAAGAIVGGAAWTLSPSPAPRVARFLLDTPDGLTLGFSGFSGGLTNDIAISPDGTRVVYASGGAGTTLSIRSLDRLESTTLAEQAMNPFVSPDGEWVGFMGTDGMWKKVSVNGGPPETLWNSPGGPPRGASWGPDDTIVFATLGSGGLRRGRATDGTIEALTTVNEKGGELGHHWPEILPGGRAVLFTVVRPGQGFLGGNQDIVVVDVSTGARKTLVRGGSYPRYVRGYIVYAAPGSLRAVPFDADRLEVTGDSLPISERVHAKPNGAANFSLTRDGTLVYITGEAGGAEPRTLVWVDRQGRERPIAAPPRAYTYVHVSPDGTKAALDVRDQQSDIWIWDFARETLSRLTFDPGLDRSPVWSPDGLRVAFSSQTESGLVNVSWRSADGSGAVERLTDNLPEQHFPISFSPDGTKLLFWKIGTAQTAWDMGVLDLARKGQMTPLVRTSFNQVNPEVSADGKWLAYQSDESGQFEVYVRPFPDVENGGKWLVSSGGGTRPRWSRDGRELFYLVEPGRVMSVPIQPGSTFTYGNPRMVFDGPYLAPQVARTYDVAPDGQRFLMIKAAQQTGDRATEPKLVLVQNWIEELKQLVAR